MSRRPRILEVVFAPNWGGLEMLALSFAEYFTWKGCPVTVAALPGSPLATRAKQAGITLETMQPHWTYADIFTARRLGRIIREQKIDIVHAHVSRDLSTLTLALKFAGRGRLILTQHMDFHRNKKDVFHRWVYSQLEHVVTLTEGMRENHLRYTPITEDRVSTIYNGVHLPEPTDGVHAVRQQWGLQQDDIVVGMMGRLDRTKRQDLLLQAAAPLAEQYPNMHMLIMGNEAPTASGRGYEAELRQLAEQSGLANRCRFTGFIEHGADAMAAIDILAHPTPSESFGLVLAEAMAQSKPVVASRAGGALEIVADGETGILCEPLNVEAFRGALVKILEDANMRSRMGQAGRERVERLFSYDNMMDQYLQLFQGVSGDPEACV
jgi:glycosyltransferase involved in cell wall biosynthesis